MTKQWLACFEVEGRLSHEAEGSIFARNLDCVYFEGFHFGRPWYRYSNQKYLPTLGKRSANCVAHAKQGKRVICKIVFNGFSAFNKGSLFS